MRRVARPPTPKRSWRAAHSYLSVATREARSQIDWRYVILDEAQQIKNPLSATARAAKRLPADRRYAARRKAERDGIIVDAKTYEYLRSLLPAGDKSASE